MNRSDGAKMEEFSYASKTGAFWLVVEELIFKISPIHIKLEQFRQGVQELRRMKLPMCKIGVF